MRGLGDTSIRSEVSDRGEFAAAQDQGVWKMTDAEFKAEMLAEWKRGFIDGHAAGRTSITTVLETLDVLIGEGLSYQEARDALDRLTKATTT